MKDFSLQRLTHLQHFYYLALGVLSLAAITGVIFSLGNFGNTASAEQNPANLISYTIPAASDETYVDNSLIDSTPTAIVPDPEDITEEAETLTERPVYTAKSAKPATTTPVVEASTPVQLSDTPTYITAGGRTNHVSVVDSTAVDPENEVKLLRLNGYLTSFYFGHNRTNVFAGLGTHQIGDKITVTAENGTVKTYTIKRMEWLTFDETKANMTDIAYSRWNGQKYAISIMTCTSSNYYGGRLIVFAD